MNISPLRRPALLVYVVASANVVFYTAFFPLVPDIEAEFGLSKVDVGALVTAYGVAFVVGSIATGLLTDRISARHVLIGTSATLAVAALGHAAAVDFWTLLAARSLYGLAGAPVLIAGLSWLSDSVPDERRDRALAAVVPITGVGAMVGFAFSGIAGDQFGMAAVFLTCTALFVATTFGLLVGEVGGSARHPYRTVGETLKAGRTARAVIAVALLFFLASLSETLINVLGALQLDDNGVSAGGIGVALAVGTGIFVVVSLTVTRFAERVVRIGVLGVTSLLLAASMVPLLVSESTAAIVSALLLRAGVFGLVYGIGFPLAALAAIRARIGLGATNGLLMLAIGASYALGPLSGAALAESVGDRWVYAALVTASVAGAAFIIATSREEQAPRATRR